jgi:endonuclease/exonuclease/phosphatase family metal-dependent hydrolase
MTYNVHGCVGTDRNLDLERTARVIAGERADVVALQEVDLNRKRSRHADQAVMLAERLGLKAHFTCAVRRGLEQYGIALLTAHDVEVLSEGCLPSRYDEVRAAQWARVAARETTVELLHTHLSVSARDRSLQLDSLLGDGWLGPHLENPHLIVCGDLNATPRSRVYRSIAERLRDVQAPRDRRREARARATWPSWFPFLRLDHTFVGCGFEVLASRVPRHTEARRASDHLPLVADLRAVS